MMIVAVTGWRLHSNTAFICASMDRLVGVYRDFQPVVRMGDAAGADEIVWRWCQDNGIDYRRYRADWDSHGKRAGPLRNRQMLTQEWYTEDVSGLGEKRWRHSKVDLLIAFPHPEVEPKLPGSGSWNCIGQAFTLGIEVLIPAYK